MSTSDAMPVHLGTKDRLPEFVLTGKVVCVSGAGRGLGLVQAEALIEAGAIVYALDRLPEPVCFLPITSKATATKFPSFSAKTKLMRIQSEDFPRIQAKASTLGTKLEYRRIDVRDTDLLNKTIEEIATAEQRMDGLIAAAGIQQETPALEYTAQDVNSMMEVNVTGVFMTAQAVAKQIIRFGKGGSIVLIASMSGTIANRVRLFPPYDYYLLHSKVPGPSCRVNLVNGNAKQ